METDFVCNLCKSTRYKKIPFRYLFRNRHINAVKCRTCGLISLYPLPSDSEIEEMYSDEYFTVEDIQTHHYQKDYLSAVQQVDYSKRVEELNKYLQDNGHVLEIGCATGELLFALKNAGYNVTGIEISDFAARMAVQRYGLNVINSSFEERLLHERLPNESYDVILMGDVLEHLKKPTEAMRYALKLLKTGGVLLVQVPSTLNLISSRLAFIFYNLTGLRKTMTIPPYHFTEFFPGTLAKMYTAAGFTMRKVIQETKHPKTITLRHSGMENMLKLLSQYPNYFITRILGIYGDRLSGIGWK